MRHAEAARRPPVGDASVGVAPVDLVIPYVDAQAPGFRERYVAAHGHEPIPCQTRTLGELRFALRSIEQHLPWIRSVVLVVQDEAHVPDWIERRQLRVVPHEEFLPAEVRQPCFNPPALFAWLYRIPGLAPRYLIWSDDQIALRPLARRRFFSRRGTPRCTLEFASIFRADSPRADDAFARRINRTFDLLAERAPGARVGPTGRAFDADGESASGGSTGRGSVGGGSAGGGSATNAGGAWPLVTHCPIPVERGLWQEFLDCYRDDPGMHALLHDAVRDGDPEATQRPLIVEFWPAWLWARNHTSSTVRAWHLLKIRLRRTLERRRLRRPRFTGYSVRHDPEHTRSQMAQLARARPELACINDDGWDLYVDEAGRAWHDHPSLEPRSQRALTSTLERLLPHPSRFERTPG